MPSAYSTFLNASFQIKDNKRKMGPALPILQNLDCVDQIWIKINHPSLVSSNIFVPLVKIGFLSNISQLYIYLYVGSGSFVIIHLRYQINSTIQYCVLLFSRFQWKFCLNKVEIFWWSQKEIYGMLSGDLWLAGCCDNTELTLEPCSRSSHQQPGQLASLDACH